MEILEEVLAQNLFDLRAFDGVLQDSNLNEEFAPFFRWWDDIVISWDRLPQPVSPSERIQGVRRDWGYFNALMESIGETSEILGQQDARAIAFMQGLGNIAFGVEILQIDRVAEGAGPLSDIEQVNLSLSIFQGVLTVWQSITAPATVDAEHERFFTFYWQQVRILDELSQLRNEVGAVQFTLASIQQMIWSSEVRVRNDIAELSRQVSNIHTTMNVGFSRTEESLIVMAEQEASVAARAIVEASGLTTPGDLSSAVFAPQFAAINDFALTSVSRPPFTRTLTGSWENLQSARFGNVSDLFVAIGSLTEATEFYNLSSQARWREDIGGQSRPLALTVADFLDFYSRAGPQSSQSVFHHNDQAFNAALSLAADVASQVPPEASVPHLT